MATTLDITDDELRRLRGRCVSEVKKTKGKIKLDDAVEFQRGADGKDRLHQNYLHRKVNGKQREYEERTKSEKRKKMEEKKAALRAEDMAKGVYILNSSLPQLEPQLV